ncbi:MAG TPA: GGDEF domain-containing protein [Actinomycetota bacterium]
MPPTTTSARKNGFRTERGDVYLSILGLLSKESEEPGVRAISTRVADKAAENVVDDALDTVAETPLAPAEIAPIERPERKSFSAFLPKRPARTAPIAPAPPVREEGGERLRDAVTGAGNWESLRREVLSETVRPTYRKPFVLVSFSIEPLDDIRRQSGPQVADDVLRTLVEVMWSCFTDDDRVYRSGDKEITVVVRDGDRFLSEGTLSKLDKSVRMALVRRSLPTVRLRLAASPAALAAYNVAGLGAVL